MGLAYRQPQVALLAFLAALALGVAGCGSGGSDEADTLSKAEYVKQADEICAKTEGRQKKLVTKFQKQNQEAPTGTAATEQLISFAALPPIEQQIQELAKLPPPDKEAAKAKAYLKELEKGLKAAEKEPGTLLITPGAFTKAEEAARVFGFKTCGGA